MPIPKAWRLGALTTTWASLGILALAAVGPTLATAQQTLTITSFGGALQAAQRKVFMEKTLFKRVEQYKDRWSSFDSETGILSLSEKPSAKELRKFEVFEGFGEKFLEQISPDIAIATWKKGSVLFEEGSFIDVAFYLVKGEVTIHLSQTQDDDAGNEPIFSPDRTLMVKRPAPPSAIASPSSDETPHYMRTQKLRTDPGTIFLSTLDFDLPRGAELPLQPGEFFGEIGALNGWPMSVTASTLTDCVVVQIRVPALRRLKKQSDAFKQRIDRIYRQRSLRGI